MLAECGRAAEAAGIDYAQLVYAFVAQEVNLSTPLARQRLCELAGVSRAGYYRWQQVGPAIDRDLDLRAEIQEIALEFPAYGRRRIRAELVRRGWKVNGKRVQRILREDNLLCLRRRKFILATTDSRHELAVYGNLARDLVVTRMDQLWVADITYIRLEVEFVYLAVILDAFSRRVIGWALEDQLDDQLTLTALAMALRHRQPGAGLVHHSDRGVQYASRNYIAKLREHRIGISMSRRGNPYDNAMCESFMKTLKHEEVYRQEYRDRSEAVACLSHFLEKVYNQKRLHSALGYLPPAEFESRQVQPSISNRETWAAL